MIDELITRVFAIRDAAHRAHWATNSFSQHEALGSFYDGVLSKLDEYVEAHQGACGVKTSDQKAMVETISNNVLWLNKNRDAIAKNIPALQNILDELAGVHLKTLYKLENLR